MILRSLLIWLALALPGHAHQASLAVLEVNEIQENRFALRWTNRPTAAEGDTFVDFNPIWPEDCTVDGVILLCEKGLSGQIGFEGLGSAQSAAMIRITGLSGATEVVLLTPTKPVARVLGSLDLNSVAGKLQMGSAYVALGFEHILVGIDHLIFVLGLMLISATTWRLVKTITAFTVAHSLTLGAVSFGLVGVPEAFVNCMIALSITFIAVEIMRYVHGGTSVTLKHPEIVSFGFGLLHGFGFASALVEYGLPDGARLVALAAFNIGVELGQLAFVVLALAVFWAWREMRAPMPPRPALMTAYVIGGVSAFWFLERAILLTGQTI